MRLPTAPRSPFGQLDVVNAGDAADEIYFVRHESYRSQQRRDDNRAGTGCRPAAQRLNLDVYVVRRLLDGLEDLQGHFAFAAGNFLVGRSDGLSFLSRSLAGLQIGQFLFQLGNFFLQLFYCFHFF